jgi:hypothetical protein
MPAAISLWFYRLEAYGGNGRAKISLADLPGRGFHDFLADFIRSNRTSRHHDELQRVWYFEAPSKSTSDEFDGILKYGVYGFESDLIDSKTKVHRFKREVGDSEQIKLYYQFWWPGRSSDGALCAFQSFQGRSCIWMILDALRLAFRDEYAGHVLHIYKIMPGTLKTSVFANAPVKSIKLVAKSLSSDARKNYGSEGKPEEFDVTMTISAKKGGTFGLLKSLDENRLAQLRLPVWLMDAQAFDRATADVEWNGHRRTVGVMGPVGAAGSFDVTEDIDFGVDGHPTLESVRDQADQLLGSFATALGYQE